MKGSKRDEILGFQIDDPDAGLNFSKRLANENGWSEEYTTRVVQEYLKFLVLCAEAGHMVTPSDAVDQAWHLHMCYTRSYWNDLCHGVMGFPLHHGPTKGGSAEREKFFDCYSETLDSYRKIFGENPALDIWPNPQNRFARQDFRRVDSVKNFIIPRRLVWLSLLGVGTLSCSVGCATSLATVKPESIVLWVIGPLVLIGLLVLISRGGGKGGSGGVGCGKSGCSADSGCGGGGCGGGGCGGGCGGG